MHISKLLKFVFTAMLAATSFGAIAQQPKPTHQWAIVLHGGAGVIERSSMSPRPKPLTAPD